MKTILLDYKKPTERFDALSICLGYFDGVHLGHQTLIKYARKNAKHILGLLTFSKPISTLVDNGKIKEVLTSLDDRFKIISKLGVDFYFVTQVDKEFTPPTRSTVPSWPRKPSSPRLRIMKSAAPLKIPDNILSKQH